MNFKERIQEVTNKHYRILILEAVLNNLSRFMKMDGQDEPELFIGVTPPTGTAMILDDVVPEEKIAEFFYDLKDNYKTLQEELLREIEQ
jgi:predicted secreted protein